MKLPFLFPAKTIIATLGLLLTASVATAAPIDAYVTLMAVDLEETGYIAHIAEGDPVNINQDPNGVAMALAGQDLLDGLTCALSVDGSKAIWLSDCSAFSLPTIR